MAIPSLHIRPRNPPAEPLVLLYSHGNAVDLCQMLPMLENYANVFNCDCVGFEYPG